MSNELISSLPSSVAAVVLAAGRGTRLRCVDRPKVMLELNDQPMVAHTVHMLEQLGLPPTRIVLVVGFQKEQVLQYFGERVSFAHQTEQLGTGHAAFTGMQALPKQVEHVLVMGGDDSAFYTPETVRRFIADHLQNDRTVTLLTAYINEPRSLGRVVRHPDGRVEIVEKELLTEEQKRISEISTGTFMFNRSWYERLFPSMPKMEKLGEYGLPTAFTIARETGENHAAVVLENPEEWFGVNTPEELAEARRRKNMV